ncbi:hypothetical protein B9W62_23040 [Streptomyces sp. CS113]|uniref:hypothetical protein n=1 Tax=Streptomyces sp. CS113 TaxID=1982761 RepID=UPI000B4117B0|nr:hypothetical protein [Streptomyces sp. CS113]OWA05512.1 hypothetical protein B9W62_23040 [Streptomyces sp. CS113]
MRRRARRTALTALLLAAGATACLTGCQSDQGGDGASDGAARSAASGGSATASPAASAPGSTAAPAEASASASASASDEPFAGLTGEEISEQARIATTGARSLHLTGSVPDEESGGSLNLDVALDRKGGCTGTMGVDGQGEIELIRTGDTLYVKFDKQFLRTLDKGEPQAGNDALAALLAGRWTSMPADGPDAKAMTGFCDLDMLLDDGGEGGDDTGAKLTRGKVTTVDGAPAITLHETTGSHRTTLYVATEGKPFLLRVVNGSGQESFSLSLTGFNEPVPAKAPSGEVIDLDGLDDLDGMAT